MEKRAPPVCQIFWFGYDQNKYSSLCGDHIFLLHFGTFPSKTGEAFIYYHLYHKESPFYLDLRTQLFNIPFVVFCFSSQ